MLCPPTLTNPVCRPGSLGRRDLQRTEELHSDMQWQVSCFRHPAELISRQTPSTAELRGQSMPCPRFRDRICIEITTPQRVACLLQRLERCTGWGSATNVRFTGQQSDAFYSVQKHSTFVRRGLLHQGKKAQVDTYPSPRTQCFTCITRLTFCDLTVRCINSLPGLPVARNDQHKGHTSTPGLGKETRL
jgi:hypothetical protein